MPGTSSEVGRTSAQDPAYRPTPDCTATSTRPPLLSGRSPLGRVMVAGLAARRRRIRRRRENLQQHIALQV